MSNFIQLCIQGKAILDDIDDSIDKWHDSDSNLELHEFLGMTEKEYFLWLNDPSILSLIVKAHYEERNLQDVINDVTTLPLAARSDGFGKTDKLINWLKKEGLWE